MHLLEALLALYEATSDPKRLKQASALVMLFQDKFFDPSGALPEYFDPAWRPLQDSPGPIVEPGHVFEWSWLLQRYRTLGGEDLGVQGERLRQFGECHGVEPSSGAVYNEVSMDGSVRIASSRLWPNTERLKSNLVAFEQTGDEGALAAALQSFAVLMAFCQTPLKGLWRDVREPDGSFDDAPSTASSFYHITLALSELVRVAEI
jgi:mannose-6-phosphate isomerase